VVEKHCWTIEEEAKEVPLLLCVIHFNAVSMSILKHKSL
jgi:hypothetical protein